VKSQARRRKQDTGLAKHGDNMREQLIEKMKVVLADSFAFYLKAQQYHWNVEGPDFPQYHEFLGNLYEEVHTSIDMIAEEIRSLGEYAPGSFSRFSELTSIQDSRGTPSAAEMMNTLLGDNQIVLNTLMEAYKLAEEYNEIGLSNFIQDRYDAHKKHAWMIRSIVKRVQ
jgi:starvation-inducible DNA-binding protein